jgi:hypothetical protein
MLKVSDRASEELKKVLESDAHRSKSLIIHFMGAG